MGHHRGRDRAPPCGRGRTVGVFSIATAVGFIFGQLSSGVLVDLFSRSAVYAVVAVFAGIVALACLFVPDQTPDRDHAVTLEHIARETARRLVPTTGTEHLRENGLLWLYLASFLRDMTVLRMSGLIPVNLLDCLHIPSVWMGVILAVNPTVQIAGMFSTGRLSDSVGRKRLIVAALALFAVGTSFSMLQTDVIVFIGDVTPAERESENHVHAST